MDYVIGLGEDERQRFIKTVTELGKAFAFVRLNLQPQNSTMRLPSLKQLKQDLLNCYNRQRRKTRKTPAEVEAEINQLVSQSVVTEDVIDVYQTLGLEQPDLSILSDDF